MLTVDARSTLHTGVRAVNPHFINPVITFRVSRRQREMYRGHARLCVCMFVCVCVSVCLSAAACPHYCTDPDVTWGSGRGCPLVVHYWADLQSVHGLRCYGNITRTWNVSEYMLVLALYLAMGSGSDSRRKGDVRLPEVSYCTTKGWRPMSHSRDWRYKIQPMTINVTTNSSR